MRTVLSLINTGTKCKSQDISNLAISPVRSEVDNDTAGTVVSELSTCVIYANGTLTLL